MGSEPVGVSTLNPFRPEVPCEPQDLASEGAGGLVREVSRPCEWFL